MIALYPHQRDAIDAAQLAIANGCQRQVVQMATGAGKTIFAAALMDELLLPSERVLFLAHREDLLKNARAAFALFFPDSDLGIVQGAHNEAGARIVFGMFQTLANPHRMAQVQVPGPFTYVIVDECHHALAPSYRRVIDTLGQRVVVGLTATPSRADKQSLRKLFQRLTYSVGMLDLICSNPPYLVDLKGYSIKTDLDLSGVGEDEWGELNRDQMRAAVHAAAHRHDLAISAIRKYALGWQGIYFAADVHDARLFAKTANASGIVTEVIVGTTPEEERARIRAAYLAGEVQYISNVAVMTEGSDLPPARVAIIGRPTRSQELYIQMVGRVTRVLPEDHGKPLSEWSKPYSLVIDLADNQHTILTLPDLIGSTDEVVRTKGVRKALTEETEAAEECEDREEEREEHEYSGARRMSLQIAPQSLLSKRPWRRDGQDLVLKTKVGTARLEAEFGGSYWVMFESQNGHTTRLSKQAVKLEQGLGLGEQKIAQLEASEQKRTEQRMDPQARRQPASPGMATVVKRLFPFLRKKQLTAGEARDWLDKHERAKATIGPDGKPYKNWWESPEGQAFSKARRKPASSRPTRSTRSTTRSTRSTTRREDNNNQRTTVIEE